MTANGLSAVDRYPDYDIDQDNISLFEGWLSRELRLPKCANCGKWHQPPRPVCPFCWSSELVPTPVSGRGVIYLAIVLEQGPAQEGVTYPLPVVTAELEEQPGLRFTTALAGAARDDVKVGAPVVLDWSERRGAPFPVFRLSGGAAHAQ
jgi:uncharacterized OB-fold protein